MNYLNLFIISVGFLYVTCAPAKNLETFYAEVIKKCPALKNDSLYENQPIFRACKDWESISQVNKLTEENKNEIKCLLYFESFTQFCVNIDVPQAVLAQYTVENICNYAKNISHKNLNAIFNDGENCQKICSDSMGYGDRMCGISLHFAVKKAENFSQTTKIEQKIESSSENVAQNSGNMPQTNQNTEINESPVKPQDLHPELPQNHDESNVNPPGVNPAKAPAIPEEKVPNVKPPPAVVPVPQEEKIPQDLQTNNDAKDHNNEAVPAAPKPLETEKKQDANKYDKEPPKEKLESPKDEEEPVKDEKKTEDIGNQEPPVDEKNPDLDAVGDFQIPSEDDDVPEPGPNTAESDKVSKPLQIDESEPVNYSTEMEGDSYFFTYFMLLCIVFIAGYVCYHNKQKVLALILEGRRGKRQYRGRRPNSANYSKLDSNLEEAITSSCKKNTNNVIY